MHLVGTRILTTIYGCKDNTFFRNILVLFCLIIVLSLQSKKKSFIFLSKKNKEKGGESLFVLDSPP